MSQLQIGLISLGAFIILAVLLFNWWQERNIKREMVRRFEEPIDDVLMGDIKGEPRELMHQEHADVEFRIGSDETPSYEEPLIIEPSDIVPEHTPRPEPDPQPEPEELEAEPYEEPAPMLAPVPDAETFADEELVEEPVWISNPAAPASADIELPANVAPLIDDIAIITPIRLCSGNTIRESLMPLPAFQQAVRWMGRNDDGTFHLITKEHEQSQFTHIVCAMQLADRSGPAHGEDLRNFHSKVEELTARVGGALEWREQGDVLQYARELDAFCIEVDVMISLQLTGSETGPFAGTKLRGLAEANGLSLQEDGQFHFINEAGEKLFSLASLDRRPLTLELLRTSMLHGVVLMMDVPRVANGLEIFNQMVMLGRKFETALSTKLSDENQQQLDDSQIDKIRQQLKAIYTKMLARGIPPGSASALRLFS